MWLNVSPSVTSQTLILQGVRYEDKKIWGSNICTGLNKNLMIIFYVGLLRAFSTLPCIATRPSDRDVLCSASKLHTKW